jgi:hypothetical protein
LKALATIVLLCALAWNCPKLIAQSVSGTVNTYYSVSAVNTASNSVVVDNGAGLSPGELVLIIQSKGATVDATNTASFGNITALGSAGSYEFNTICNVSGNQVWLKAPFSNTYDPTGNLQLVGVPSYQSVMVSATVSATAWDPATGKGGIVVIKATDTIYLDADIDVSGQGFQGGYLVNYPTPAYNCSAATTVNQYFLGTPASGNVTAGRKGEGIAAYILNEENAKGKLANGGGGGNNANSGGAGGGNYGAGGNGGKRAGESPFNCHGQNPGIGGLSLAAYGYSGGANRIFFGGGGGAGHENNAVGTPGGNGGGIIILSATTIIGGGGRLLANGQVPSNPANSDPLQAEGDGAGGGGAGGTIILSATNVTGPVTAQAIGATGSNSSNGVNDCTGPGGGGGGGIVWTSGASVPAAISASVGGGANGVVSSGSSSTAGCVGSSDGATAGAAGISQAGYVLPLSSGSVCVVLASPLVSYFTGSALDQGSLLSWGLTASAATAGVTEFILERSPDHLRFTVVADVPSSGDLLRYTYTDPTSLGGTTFYRLSWMDHNQVRAYSPIVAINRPMTAVDGALALFPNPATDQLSIRLLSTANEPVSMRVFNAQGQQLSVTTFSIHVGANLLSLPVHGLARGAYFLSVEYGGKRQVRSFLVRN